jgi:cytoskeleton protein RodZ
MPDDLDGTEVMEDGLGAGTQSVGAGLRAVRERLGWKLPEVADTLRIRQEFLEAIEAGNLAALPGPAYRSGFVRSYARTLGLDPDEILRRFRAEGGLPDPARTETRFITTVPDSGVPKGAAVMVGIVLLLAGYGIWYHYSGTQRRLAEQVPAVPAQLAPLATPPKLEVAPITPAPAPAPVTPGPTTAPAPAATPAATTPAPVAGTTLPATVPATPAPGAGLVISATQDAWIEVHDPAGNILFSKVLHPGESWPVPQESGLTLTTGNAGGTVITNNGVAGAPLGAPSAVLHNYQLTPAAAGTTPATPAPAAPAVTTPAVAPTLPSSAAAKPAAPSTTTPPTATHSTTPSAAPSGKKSQAAPGGTP